jgi:hypothetical protein
MRYVVLSKLAVPGVAALAALACAAPAWAVPGDLRPAGGEVLTTPYPAFSWTLGPGETGPFVYVATSPAVNDKGQLSSPSAFVTESHLAGRATAYSDPATAYRPGTYWWQVSAWAPDGATLVVAPPRRFVVPAIFDLSDVRLDIRRDAAGTPRALHVAARLRCNTIADETFQTLRVYRHRRLLYAARSGPLPCGSTQPADVAHDFAPGPGDVPAGARLTVLLRERAGGHTGRWHARRVVWR